MQQLEINVALQVGRLSSSVFEAIINPEKMKNYFISSGSGKMEEGKTVIWRFPEFDFDAPISVGKIEKDKYISFSWEGSEGKELTVEMFLEPQVNNSTIVRISEKSMENNPEGIEWLSRNTEGWANFLACLKAYLEHGINLREGAFDFMRE
ncbi:MAG: SRPBCC domain-containing protein [Dysgonomonas sp.]